MSMVLKKIPFEKLLAEAQKEYDKNNAKNEASADSRKTRWAGSKTSGYGGKKG